MHTKEPWFSAYGNIYGADQHFIAAADFGSNSHVNMDDNGLTIDRGHDVAEENTRRIVACVNACSGIADPEQFISDARSYSHETVSAIVRQRDELVEALRNLELGANTIDACYTRNPGNFAAALCDLREYAAQAREAIANAKPA